MNGSSQGTAQAGVDLMLSGHTHGGQVWPFSLLVSMAQPMLGGRYEVERTGIPRWINWLTCIGLKDYPTGNEKGPLHRYVGYAVLGLMAVRIVWGFCGTKHALFSDFICSPVKVLTYLKELVTGKPTHYIGHNPAAAWMIIFLLANSMIICLSGYAAYAVKGNTPSFGFGNTSSIVESAYADDDGKREHKDKHERRGGNPKSAREDDERDSVWSDIHEMSAQFMLLLIGLHIMGIAVSSIMKTL